MPAIGVHVGSSFGGGYFAGYQFGHYYAAILASAGGTAMPFAGWEYLATDSNMMTMYLGGYKGQTTSDWSDCRFMFNSGVNIGGAVLGSLQLGARGYSPFWGLGSAGVADIYRDDQNNRISTARNLFVGGALSKTSGTFDISHPDPAKTATRRLRHAFTESPTRGQNLYTYDLAVPEGWDRKEEPEPIVALDPERKELSATARRVRGGLRVDIPLPDYWPYLNEHPRAWVSNVGEGWGQAKATVDAKLRTLRVTLQEPGEYQILLIGTRKDPDAVAMWDRRGVEYGQGQKVDTTTTMERRALRLSVRKGREEGKNVVARPLLPLHQREVRLPWRHQ
jgi:hypothetical protein